MKKTYFDCSKDICSWIDRKVKIMVATFLVSLVNEVRSLVSVYSVKAAKYNCRVIRDTVDILLQKMTDFSYTLPESLCVYH